MSPHMTPDECIARTRAQVSVAIVDDPHVAALFEHARSNVPSMMRDLDPRTPPEAVGQAIALVASDALALATGVEGHLHTDSRSWWFLVNTLAVYAEAFMRHGEQR